MTAQQRTPEPGDAVFVRDAFDHWLCKTAVTGVIAGHDFAVVRVRWADEDDPEGMPWPAEDVVLAAHAEPKVAAEALDHDAYRVWLSQPTEPMDTEG